MESVSFPEDLPVQPETRAMLKGLALGVAMSSSLFFFLDREDEQPSPAPLGPTSSPTEPSGLSTTSLSEFLNDYTHATASHGGSTDLVDADLQAFLKAGEWMRAYQLADEQLQTNPDDVEALLALAEVRIQMGQPTRANSLIVRALVIEPAHAQALGLRAQMVEKATHP